MSIQSKVEFYISKAVSKAIYDYNMIEDKEKILVAVSGGKDSLCLLHILKKRLKFVPIRYELYPVHISLDDDNAKVIKDYLKKDNFNLKVKKIRLAGNKTRKNPCFFCSWRRREYLFKMARKLDCRKIALAHHKDDIVQTMLLNLFFNAEISTMVPKKSFFGGKFQLIRPLAYVEEKMLVTYTKELNLPKLPRQCRYADNSKRRLMANIISQVEAECKNVKTNIFKALKRIKSEYLP